MSQLGFLSYKGGVTRNVAVIVIGITLRELFPVQLKPVKAGDICVVVEADDDSYFGVVKRSDRTAQVYCQSVVSAAKAAVTSFWKVPFE